MCRRSRSFRSSSGKEIALNVDEVKRERPLSNIHLKNFRKVFEVVAILIMIGGGYNEKLL